VRFVISRDSRLPFRGRLSHLRSTFARRVTSRACLTQPSVSNPEVRTSVLMAGLGRDILGRIIERLVSQFGRVTVEEYEQ
jgi:hypothetical protein